MAVSAAAFFVMHIAGIDISQPVLHRDLPRPAERGRRRARFVEHLVVGMEGREVERHIRS